MTSPTTDRLHALDTLRGFALLGILMVNVQWFASAWWAQGLPDPRDVTVLDHAARWLVAFAFEGKFYLLFSFAFGYSFTLVMQRGGDALPRYRRRLAALALLGAVHALLLFHGDVLLFYAALGLLLPRASRWSVGRVVLTAVGVQLAVAGVLLVLAGTTAREDLQAFSQASALRAAEAEAAMRGSGADLVWLNLQTWVGNLLPVSLVQLPNMLAWLLLGHAAARAGLLARVRDGAPRIGRGLLVALVLIGVAGQGVYAATSRSIDPALSLLGAVALTLTAPALSIVYAVLLWRLPAAVQRALAWAGRMSLSNYLLQSMVLALLFTGWGLGWSGQVAPPVVVAMVALVFAVQLALSALWLRRHEQGPLEAWVRRVSRKAVAPADA